MWRRDSAAHVTLGRMSARICWLVGVWVVLLWAVPGAAASSADSEPDAMLLPTRVTAEILLDLCAEELGVTIEYPAGGLGGRGKGVTLRSGGGFSRDALWVYTHEVLEQAGWTTVVGGSGERLTYRVVPLADAFDRSSVFGAEPAWLPGYVVRRYDLGGLDAGRVIEALGRFRPILGQVAVATADGSAVDVGAVTRRHDEISGYLERERRVLRSVEVVFVAVEHRGAGEVVASVGALMESGLMAGPRGGVAAGPRDDLVVVTAPGDEMSAWRGLIGRFDVPAGVETRAYAIGAHDIGSLRGLIEETARGVAPAGSGERWKVVENTLARTLMVTATPGEHERIGSLMDQMASVPDDASERTVSFVVKNRNASDLIRTLSRLLGVGGMNDGTGSGGSEPGGIPNGVADGGKVAGHGLGHDGLRLAVDDAMNAVIASGRPAALERVGALVAELDVLQPQVLLEVVLVSLSEGESRDLGVEIQARLGTSGTLVGLGSLFGLSSVDPSGTVPTVGGNGGSAVILDPGDFSVVLRALETVSDGRSVSTARTLVNNNESANLSNTVSEPYAEVVFDDGDSITGFGGAESAGTTISVTPQIASGGFLVLDYNISLSAFLGEATPGLPPASQSTSISSVATIPDGHSIVVGGLELLNRSESESRTPVLGSIPVLGGLFRSESGSNSRTRFYLFIRATVMRSPGFERLRYLSDVRAGEVGVDTGWPEVEPVIIR